MLLEKEFNVKIKKFITDIKKIISMYLKRIRKYKTTNPSVVRMMKGLIAFWSIGVILTIIGLFFFPKSTIVGTFIITFAAIIVPFLIHTFLKY